MGWWRRMRNKLKSKSSPRPVRYAGHIANQDEPYVRRGAPVVGGARADSNARGYRAPFFSSTRGGGTQTPTEKTMIEEGRFSSSLLRPSMMSDRSAYFQEMSFELPRR